MTVRLPSIPSVSSKVAPEVSSLLRPMREILNDFLSGDGQVATMRALRQAGLIGAANPDGSIAPAAAGVDRTPPPQPTGLTATGALANIMLSWDKSNYASLAYTEVWRAPADDFSVAQLVGTSAGCLYADNVGKAATLFYWIRGVSLANVPGPFNAQRGVRGETGADPDYLLSLLTDQITASQFDQDLGARIDLIDLPETGLVTRTRELTSQVTTLQSRIVNEADAAFLRWDFNQSAEGWTASAAAIAPLASSITWEPGAANCSLSRALSGSGTVERFAGASYPKVRARVRRLSGTGSWEGKCYYSTSAPAVRGSSGDFYKKIAEPQEPDQWHVLEWDMAALSAGGADWLDSTISAIRLDLVSGPGTKWEIDWIAVGRFDAGASPQDVASLQVSASVLAGRADGLAAQYTVKTDTAGLISGFGLASEAPVDATPSSMFGVRASQFYVAAPATASATEPTANLYDGYVWLDTGVTPNVRRYRSGTAWVLKPPRLPFVVRATPTTLNGVAIPAGVYIGSAFIENGSITNAKIGNAAIDDAKISSLDAAKIKSGYIDAARIKAGTLDAKIANLDAAVIMSGYLDTARIKAASISTAHIASAAITTAKIDDGAITNAKIKSLDASKITAGYLDAARVKVGSINADRLVADTITADLIVSKSATSFEQIDTWVDNNTWKAVQFYMDHAGTVALIAQINFTTNGYGSDFEIRAAFNSQTSYSSDKGSNVAIPGAGLQASAWLAAGYHTINVYAQHSAASGKHLAHLTLLKSYR